jgi:hypothetical protein
VDRPTATHAYGPAVPAPRVAATLAALRAERGVTLAEPLELGR